MEFDQADIEASVERILNVTEKWMNRDARKTLTTAERKRALNEIEASLIKEARRPPAKRPTEDGQDR